MTDRNEFKGKRFTDIITFNVSATTYDASNWNAVVLWNLIHVWNNQYFENRKCDIEQAFDEVGRRIKEHYSAIADIERKVRNAISDIREYVNALDLNDEFKLSAGVYMENEKKDATKINRLAPEISFSRGTYNKNGYSEIQASNFGIFGTYNLHEKEDGHMNELGYSIDYGIYTGFTIRYFPEKVDAEDVKIWRLTENEKTSLTAKAREISLRINKRLFKRELVPAGEAWEVKYQIDPTEIKGMLG